MDGSCRLHGRSDLFEVSGAVTTGFEMVFEATAVATRERSFAVNGNGLLVFTGSSVAPELPGHSGLEGIAVS